MTTETLLTEEIISELSTKHLWAHPQFVGAGEVAIEGDDHFARAIEQAVLQSPEVQALRKDAETERAIQRAAEVLPRDWQITIEVEQGSGYVNLHFQGDEIEFGEPSDGIADRIKDAISAAMEQPHD